jgi:hypothetical protein
MTDIIQSPMKSLIIRTRSYPEPPEGCPITAMIARGRKGESREQQLSIAEHIAAGIKRRKVSGIYKVRP